MVSGLHPHISLGIRSASIMWYHILGQLRAVMRHALHTERRGSVFLEWSGWKLYRFLSGDTMNSKIRPRVSGGNLPIGVKEL